MRTRLAEGRPCARGAGVLTSGRAGGRRFCQDSLCLSRGWMELSACAHPARSQLLPAQATGILCLCLVPGALCPRFSLGLPQDHARATAWTGPPTLRSHWAPRPCRTGGSPGQPAAGSVPFEPRLGGILTKPSGPSWLRTSLSPESGRGLRWMRDRREPAAGMASRQHALLSPQSPLGWGSQQGWWHEMTWHLGDTSFSLCFLSFPSSGPAWGRGRGTRDSFERG